MSELKRENIVISGETLAPSDAGGYLYSTNPLHILVPTEEVYDLEIGQRQSEINKSLNDIQRKEDNVNQAIAATFVDLDDRKLDATAYTEVDTSNYYTKDETSNEIDSAINGVNGSLDTINDNLASINDDLGGLKFVVITESEYNALETKDSNTIYFIQ